MLARRGWGRHACLALLLMLPLAVMLAVLDVLAWEPVLDCGLLGLIVSGAGSFGMAAIAIRTDRLRNAGIVRSD